MAAPSGGALTKVWQPRYAIEKNHQIVTFGSCFAQHISRELVAGGYSWLNAEQAPKFNGSDYALEYGYDVFSARTGNIYTTAQLRQWAEWAVGDATPPDEIWQDGDRFQDPFRPNIEPGGFASRDEVMQSRQVAIERFGQAITQADWLIFTMGQTECWQNVEHGHFYAMCPGTIAGSFEPDKHRFRNLGYSETEAEMRAAIAIFRRLNPALKILLTVSPVPMTATGSRNHVLIANGFTKSTLRAVAATLSTEEGIDYFPSYELITTPGVGRKLFEANKRSVSARGVRMVMGHFKAGLEGDGGETPVPAKAVADKETDLVDDDFENDVACEERMLDAFAPR